MIDPGCYGVHFLLFVTGQRPEVRSAVAECVAEQIDGHMGADLTFLGGLTAHIESAILTTNPVHEIHLVGQTVSNICA